MLWRSGYKAGLSFKNETKIGVFKAFPWTWWREIITDLLKQGLWKFFLIVKRELENFSYRSTEAARKFFSLGIKVTKI